MSQQLHLRAHGEPLVFDPGYEGKYLMDDPAALDRLAAGARVRPLVSFLARPAKAWHLAEEQGDGPSGCLGALFVSGDDRKVEWHDAESCLTTVRAIRDAIEAGGAVGRGDRRGVLDTLGTLEMRLDAYVQEERRVHFYF